MPPGRPGHLRSFDYIGFHRYFMAFCTYFRRRLFTTDSAVNLTLSKFLRTAREEAFDIRDYNLGTPHPQPVLRTMELGPRDWLSQAFMKASPS